MLAIGRMHAKELLTSMGPDKARRFMEHVAAQNRNKIGPIRKANVKHPKLAAALARLAELKSKPANRTNNH
jgi:hypothetical protein